MCRGLSKVRPAGIADTSSEDIISGVLDIVRSGEGPEASRKWAASCMLSGECIKACDTASIRASCLPWRALPLRRPRASCPTGAASALKRYRDLNRDVTVLSRLQLDGEVLERLGQNRRRYRRPSRSRISYFTPAANVLKTPHIALLALDIRMRSASTYQVMGGPSHCCGIMQLRPGDIEMSGRMGTNSIEKLSHSKSAR